MTVPGTYTHVYPGERVLVDTGLSREHGSERGAGQADLAEKVPVASAHV